MSSQVAKSSGNNANSSGRRMPMSLGGGGTTGKSTNSTKDDSAGSRNVDSASFPAMSKNVENDSKSAGTGNKNITNVEVKANERGLNVAKQENGTTEKKTTTVGPSNRRTISQSSSTSGNETNKTDEKNEKKISNENSRQKESRNKSEKKVNESNSGPNENAIIVIDDDDKVDEQKEEKEKKTEENAQPNNGEMTRNDTKQQAPETSKNRSRPNTPKSKSKSKDGKATPIILLKQLPLGGEKQQRNGQKDSQMTSDNSNLLLIPEGDDMESLMFEVDIDEPGSKRFETSTPGKVLKYKKPPPSAAEKKKEKKESEAASSTQPLPSIPEKKHPASSAKVDGKQHQTMLSSMASPVPYNSISGRRSIRPLREYSFQSSPYRETYRKINTELDCSTSSMNVTVGSERLNDESRLSFSFFGRGKKRERTPPPSTSSYSTGTIETGAGDAELSPKQSKRARLDLSGFFGFVSSPVTMLTSRFTRTKVDCSGTPNGKSSKDNVDCDSIHPEDKSEVNQEKQTGVENVTTAGGSPIDIGTSAITYEQNKTLNKEDIETVNDEAGINKIVDENKLSEVEKMNISDGGNNESTNQENVQEMEQDEIKNAEGPILLKESKEDRIQEAGDTAGKRRLCRIM